jgi:hypothetical protein
MSTETNTGSNFIASPLYTSLPNTTSSILPGYSATPIFILTSSGTFSLPSNTVVSGSAVSTINLVGTSFTNSNLWTTYLLLSSGSATSLGTSGSVYWFDYSPDGLTWFGTGSQIANSGSTNVMNTFVPFSFSGSAPYWRFHIKNQSGSAISAKLVMLGR